MFQFVFNFQVLGHFGASSTLDSYYFSASIPQIISGIFIFPMCGMLLPTVTCLHDKIIKEISAVIVLIGLFLFVILLFFISIFMNTSMINSFGNVELVKLVCIQLLLSPLIAIALLQNSIFHAKCLFLYPEVVNFASQILLCLIFYIFSDTLNLVDVTYILIVKQMFIVFFCLFVIGFSVPTVNSIRIFFHVLLKCRALIVVNSITKFEPVIERTILMSIGDGLLSLYYFSQQFFTFATQVVNKSYVATLVPQISIYLNDKLFSELHVYIGRHLKKILYLTVVAFVFIIISFLCAKHIGLSYKQFTGNNVEMLIFIFALSSGALFFSLPRDFIYTFFYASGDSKTPSFIDMYSFVIFVLIKVVSVYLYGLHGFLVAISLQAFFKLFFAKKAFNREYEQKMYKLGAMGASK